MLFHCNNGCKYTASPVYQAKQPSFTEIHKYKYNNQALQYLFYHNLPIPISHIQRYLQFFTAARTWRCSEQKIFTPPDDRAALSKFFAIGIIRICTIKNENQHTSEFSTTKSTKQGKFQLPATFSEENSSRTATTCVRGINFTDCAAAQLTGNIADISFFFISVTTYGNKIPT